MTDSEEPSETRRDAFGTRREANDPQPDDPRLTRRDAATAAAPFMRLPVALTERFAVVGDLPAQGAESDLLHVRDQEGTELVVKIFRRGFTADRSVWRKLPTLNSPNVVRILETGHAEGRDYEVIEYVPAGNLRALGSPLPPPLVAEVVAQLAEGLNRLHEAGIVHRDLKPENVLVRTTAPLRLAIADFGLSRVIDQSVVFASSSRTLAYAAPESLSGQVSPARDWWSLGIIARELLTGHSTFAGMSETAVVDHLATRTIDCDDIADARMRLLCRGLLVRDPRRRWGGAQVADWLAGASPQVADAEPAAPPGAAARAGGGLAFGGRTYTDRGELARALAADWDTAARVFFAAMFTPVGPSQAWQALRDWLNGFDDDPEGRDRLIDDHLTGDRPPDVKLLFLLRWLDPSLQPYFLGLRLRPEDLPVLAAAVEDTTHADHRSAARALRMLWDHRLLPALAGFADAPELAAVDQRWQGLAATWNRNAGWLRSRLPGGPSNLLPDAGAAGLDEPPAVLGTLLALAARPEETRETLITAAAQARASVREAVPWFSWLCEQAEDDPLRLLVVVRTASHAYVAAEDEARRRYEAEQRAIEGGKRWEERERTRLAGRRPAITRALLITLPLLPLWVGGSWAILAVVRLASSERGSQAVDVSRLTIPLLVLAAVLWLAESGTEALLAAKQGGDYLASGPWSGLAKVSGSASQALSGASRTMSRTARATGRRGCGVAILLGILPLLMVLLLIPALIAIVWLLWLAMLVMAPIGHLLMAGIRLQRWRQEHERARRQALGQPAIAPAST